MVLPYELTPQITRKAVKHLRLRIKPADGSVHVSAPLRVSEKTIRDFVKSRREWIERKQAEISQRVPVPQYQYTSGETHYLAGHPYLLQVTHQNRGSSVHLTKEGCIHLCVPVAADRQTRQRRMENWYREYLRTQVPPFLTTYLPKLQVTLNEFRIKRMKTRWGSCNPRAKRIWLNLELAKRPVEHLEYVLVHELAHLLERGHGPRFRGLMDGFLPDWRAHKQALEQAPPPGQ